MASKKKTKKSLKKVVIKPVKSLAKVGWIEL